VGGAGLTVVYGAVDAAGDLPALPDRRRARRHRAAAHLSAQIAAQPRLWCGAIVVAVIVTQTFGMFRLKMLTSLGTQVARDLRHKVYEHLHSLSLRFFAKRRTGSLITRVTTDTDRLWDFIVFGSVNLVRDLLMIVVFAGVMFYFNWKLAIAALLPVPPLGGADVLPQHDDAGDVRAGCGRTGRG
jgi:ABC-type multidrug transport system fused ATPase/permease subunit